MNQMPSREDCDDVVVSSPNSINLKREREKPLDFDLERDRACDMSSRGSDEEEGGTTRKKLRLSKEQSALLEESFKEHSTLNPVSAHQVLAATRHYITTVVMTGVVSGASPLSVCLGL